MGVIISASLNIENKILKKRELIYCTFFINLTLVSYKLLILIIF